MTQEAPLVVPIDMRPLTRMLMLSGLVTTLVGIMVLVWPGLTAIVATAILAVYTIVTGIFYAVAAATSRDVRVSARVGLAVAALLFIATGIIAFANPAESSVILASIVIIFLGMTWISEGLAAVMTLSTASNKGTTLLFALVSVVAGISLLISPLVAGALILTWLAITLIVLGITQVVRARQLSRLL